MIRMIAAIRDVIVAAGIVLGGPVLLTAAAGSPIPHQLPTAAVLRVWLDDPLNPAFAAVTGRTIGWLVWAACALAVLFCLAGRLSRLPARLRHLMAYLPPPVQGLTATMVGAAAVTTTAAAPAAAAAPPPASPVDTVPPATGHQPAVTTPIAPAWHDTGPSAHPGANPVLSDRLTRSAGTGPGPTCVVRRHDTLFDLAAHYLGDGNRWPQIYRLNRGTSFPRVGGRLTNPDLIYPGWTLRLPRGATASTGDPTAAPRHRDPDRPDTAAPAAPHPRQGAAAASSAGTAPATPAATAPTPPASPAAPRASGDDGVAGPAPTSPDGTAGGSSSHPATGSAAASSRSAADGGDSTGERGAAAHGIWLPGGSWIDLGLASAIVAAAALVWAHRRRRYTRRPPSADLRLDDPDLAPMPPVITQLRRRLRHPAPGDTVPTGGRMREGMAGQQPPAEGDPVPGDRRADTIGEDSDPDDDTGDDIDGDQAEEEVGGQLVPGDGSRPRPTVPALTHPLIEVWPAAGLGLIGPGAPAAARGFLVAALAAGGVDDPDARTQVVMPAATADTLLGAAAATLPQTPRLTVTAGLDAALDLLEAHTLHRTRLVYTHEADDLTALRTADPDEEPLPPILLLADPTGRHQRRRIAALLAQGQRLDIHGVLLGAWPDGTTITVAGDGATTPDGDAGRHRRHPADLGRLTVLDPIQTTDLIGTLAESHTGHPSPAAPAEPPPPPAPGPTSNTLAPAPTDPAPPPAPPSPHREPPTDLPPQDRRAPGAAVGKTPAPRPAETSVIAGEPTHPEVVQHRPDPADADPAEPPSHRGRIGVTVLGPPTISGADPHRPLRAKSLELLVYLAVHDGTAAAETILDDLLPDAPASKALHRLHTYVSDLRAALRATAGPGTYLTHTGRRYTLTTDTLDIDLWRQRAALRDATIADTPTERAAALRRAVDSYTGPLADGCDYEWVEPHREGVRRQALDAALALADLLTDQPAEQLTVLQTALAHHPYAEPLYQAAMRAHATLGHLDAIRALRRTLTRRLAEIDAEPTDDSLTLADHLVSQLHRPHAQSGPRPAATAGRSGDGATP